MYAVAPLLPGSVSWGLVTGIALVKAGLTTGQALGMAALVFSGTAQLVTIPLIVAGASLPLVMLTVFLTNLRFIIYSATLARDLGRLRLPLRLGLGYLTSDTGLAAYRLSHRDGEPQVQRVALFAGCSIPVYVAWQAGIVAGIWRGRRFGPLVAENLPVTVRASETMHGRARLTARAADAAHAAAALREGAAGRLARRLGLSARADAGETADAAADRLRIPRTEVRELLTGALPTADAELVPYARRLSDLESAVDAAVAAERGRP